MTSVHRNHQQPSLVRDLRHALPVILAVSLMTFVLAHFGWLRSFETTALDTWLRMHRPADVPEIVVVAITDRDYAELFSGMSPLRASTLTSIIDAIALGKPRVIGVDIDTSHESFAVVNPAQSWPTVVWAQGADLGSDARHPQFDLMPVLGGRERDPLPSIGIALLPQDADGIIRRYLRTFETSVGRRDAFAWAVTRRYRQVEIHPDGDEAAEELVLNFAGNRYSFSTIPAGILLKAARGQGWAEAAPVRDKIVLLGGFYRAARDDYVTPVGRMAGTVLVAQAIASDLRGGGIRPANEVLMVALEILSGLLLVLVHHRLRPGHALMVSLLFIPVLSLASSLFAFSSVAMWANFVPTLAAVLIHELHHHAVEYRRMYFELQALRAVTASTPTGAAVSVEEPPSAADDNHPRPRS